MPACSLRSSASTESPGRSWSRFGGPRGRLRSRHRQVADHPGPGDAGLRLPPLGALHPEPVRRVTDRPTGRSEAGRCGAWAGELGQTQFMASNYYKFAVDFDGDGRRDLFRSTPDVLASTANYLRAHGCSKAALGAGDRQLPGPEGVEQVGRLCADDRLFRRSDRGRREPVEGTRHTPPGVEPPSWNRPSRRVDERLTVRAGRSCSSERARPL